MSVGRVTVPPSPEKIAEQNPFVTQEPLPPGWKPVPVVPAPGSFETIWECFLFYGSCNGSLGKFRKLFKSVFFSSRIPWGLGMQSM